MQYRYQNRYWKPVSYKTETGFSVRFYGFRKCTETYCKNTQLSDEKLNFRFKRKTLLLNDNNFATTWERYPLRFTMWKLNMFGYFFISMWNLTFTWDYDLAMMNYTKQLSQQKQCGRVCIDIQTLSLSNRLLLLYPNRPLMWWITFAASYVMYRFWHIVFMWKRRFTHHSIVFSMHNVLKVSNFKAKKLTVFEHFRRKNQFLFMKEKPSVVYSESFHSKLEM